MQGDAAFHDHWIGRFHKSKTGRGGSARKKSRGVGTRERGSACLRNAGGAARFRSGEHGRGHRGNKMPGDHFPARAQGKNSHASILTHFVGLHRCDRGNLVLLGSIEVIHHDSVIRFHDQHLTLVDDLPGTIFPCSGHKGGSVAIGLEQNLRGVVGERLGIKAQGKVGSIPRGSNESLLGVSQQRNHSDIPGGIRGGWIRRQRDAEKQRKDGKQALQDHGSKSIGTPDFPFIHPGCGR